MLIVAAVFSLASCGFKELSTEPTAYYMIYSGRDNEKCRIEGIDINGNPTAIYNIGAINITKSAIVGDEFVAGGHRANNHLIMQKDGSFEEFYLLDDPQYSGVWCITLNGSNIVSVMNGNIDNEKGVYLNLLVIQDRNQNVAVKEEIDMTPNTLLIDGDWLYMGGCFWQYDVSPAYCGASVARYNIKTGEYEEKHFDYNANEVTAAEYKSLEKHGDDLYGICNESLMDKDLMTRQNRVDIIDGLTLELVDSLTFDGKIDGMCFADNKLYMVITDKLYKVGTETYETKELYAFPQNTAIESSHLRNGHIYYFARFLSSQKEGKMKNIGYIIDFDTADNSVTQTPLITDAKNAENVVFFPLGEIDM